MACSQQNPSLRNSIAAVSPRNAKSSWETGSFGVFFPFLSSLSLYDRSFSGQRPWSFKARLKLHTWISEQLRRGQSAFKFNVQDVLTAQAVIQGISREKPNEGCGQFWSLARRAVWGNLKSSLTRTEVMGQENRDRQWFYWLRSAAIEIGGSWTSNSDQQLTSWKAHLKFNIQEIILRGAGNGRWKRNFMQFFATLKKCNSSQKKCPQEAKVLKLCLDSGNSSIPFFPASAQKLLSSKQNLKEYLLAGNLWALLY